jgi:hypothetical protein
MHFSAREYSPKGYLDPGGRIRSCYELVCRSEEQLDRPLPTVIELLPWRESNKTLRQLLENIIFTKEVWTAVLSGADMDVNGPPSIAALATGDARKAGEDRCRTATCLQ